MIVRMVQYLSVVSSAKWTACLSPTTQSSASKITCIVCESDESWDDCDSNGKETQCASNYDRCSSIYNKQGEGKESFSRGCSNVDTCRLLKEACTRLGKGSCDVTCCDGDKCNAPVPPLFCFTCASHSSWGDCDSARQKVRCAPEEDTCAKIYASTQLGSYTKKCMPKDKCAAIKQTCTEANKREVSGDECGVDCCQGDLCNAVARQLVSVVLALVLSAVQTYFVADGLFHWGSRRKRFMDEYGVEVEVSTKRRNSDDFIQSSRMSFLTCEISRSERVSMTPTGEWMRTVWSTFHCLSGLLH